MIPVPVDTLWMIAEHEGIEVIWYPGTLYPRGQYCIANGRAFIFLNPAIRENSMRYRCTFAHELGHHFAGVGADGMGGDGRDDERAMRWGASHEVGEGSRVAHAVAERQDHTTRMADCRGSGGVSALG